MKTWHVFLLAGVTLIGVFLLTLAWVVLLDGGTVLSATAAGADLLSQRLQPVLMVTGIAGLALILPVLFAIGIVTPHKPAATEAEESTADFGVLPQFAQDAIIAIDEKGLVELWNKAAESMFGYSADEMYGDHLTKIIPQRHQDDHARGLERINADGERHIIGRTVELTGVRDNGEEFPLELSLSTWTTGRERHFGAIIRDITERVRAQEALRRSEETLRKLVETAPDAVIVIDAAGRILAWNPGAQHTFGYQEQEAIGKDVIELIPQRYRQAHQEGMARFCASGEARLSGKTLDLHGIRKDGREFPLQLSLGTWSAGEQSYFSAIIRETGVTEDDAA